MAVRPQIVTLDGPAGVGKGTLAERLARELGFYYIELGLYYRAVAAKVIEFGTDPVETAWKLVELDLLRADLRTVEVTQLTPQLSDKIEVRNAVEPFIRERADRMPGSVIDGRSGMYVFPNADVRIFLTADFQTRVLRRQTDYRQKGSPRSSAAVRREIQDRDTRDRTRSYHPLLTDEQARQTEGLCCINSTDMGIEMVYQHVLAICREKLGLVAA